VPLALARSGWPLARNGADEVVGPPVASGVGKAAVVQALLDPGTNLEFAGFLLATYATQWELTPGAATIRYRPEILATLYQVGFGRSHPKADPRPNSFGKDVGAAAGLDWVREAFPSARLSR